MYYVINSQTGEILAKNLVENFAIAIMNDFARNGFEGEMQIVETADLFDEVGDFA